MTAEIPSRRIETTREIVIGPHGRCSHAEICAGFGVVITAVGELETSGILGKFESNHFDKTTYIGPMRQTAGVDATRSDS